jgi:uncharacterized repeat protein (TIGR04052 family)
MSIHPAHLSLVLASIYCGVGCGDDTITSNSSAHSSDAGESPAADGGKRGAAGSGDNKRDASADAAPHVNELTDTGQPAAPVAEDEQAVKLRFRAQLGDAPFACGSTYAAQGSSKQTISPHDLRLFIQDVALIDAEGHEVPVRLDTREPWQTADVALLDFEDASGECFGNEATNGEITGVVPKGEYRALRFSHGVPDKLNHSDPKTFPPPLLTPGMSWNWLLGLRFVRFEVGTTPGTELDSDAGADPGSFALHIGSTGCAGNQNEGTIQCRKPNRSRVELKDFELGQSEVILDVGPLLRGNDLAQTVECHSGTAVCEPLFKALGVSYATGQPGADQSVFRLE